VKLLKMFGLAAMTALMVIAFAGAGSAMANGSTALCKDDPGAGACDDIVTHVHETTVSKARLLSSFITVECDVLFLGDALNSGLANPLVIYGNFTYTNCGNCTVTDENIISELKVLKTSHETAKVTSEILVHFDCGIFVDCTYIGAGMIGTAKGPLLSTHLNGDVTFSEQVMSKFAGLAGCSNTAKLDINTTPLEHTYIGS
jgi:hypothetical protein